MQSKKFGMISLGCDKNRVDGERILGEIRANGFSIVTDLSEAEVLIINTCAFLNAAREEGINEIISAAGTKGKGKLEKIVVSGCLSEKFIKELYPALTEADVFLGIHDAKELFPALERAYAGERVNAVGKAAETRSARVVSTPEHYKYLKIADGCSNFCTYCLIPKIRGKYRSYPMDELVEEAKSLGYTQELILVAQDTTRYGEDGGDNEFVTLLKKISALDNIRRVRLLYCYPEKIDGALIREIRDNPKILKYLDVPLQHSENRILKLMGRRGTKEEYEALFATLRKEIPEIAIRTTFISGFPSETEEEHKALTAFIEEQKFENAGVFAYSREPETPAYRMKGQIPAGTKKRRRRELYLAQRQVSENFLKTFVGKVIPVACDGVNDEGTGFVGRAYFQAPEIDGKVFFTAPRAKEGEIYRIKIEESSDYDLYGTQIED